MQVKRKILIDVIAWDNQARFIIPPWQRHYVWGEHEVRQMWIDWENDCANDRKHFCGVLLFRQLPDSTTSWEIVDGQQRMTTFFLFFLALREVCEQQRIDFTELGNAFTLPGSSTCRLVLQEGVNEDRDVMNALLNRTTNQIEENIREESALYKAYRVFITRLSKMRREEIPPFVLKVLQNVDFVVLTVDEGDDTRHIFEALNSRGKQVDPDDLVANLITYTIADNPELNEKAKEVWSVITNMFDHEELAVFLDTFGLRNGKQTERGTAFDEIKFEIDAAVKANRVKEWLKEFKRAANNYNDILSPANSDDPIQVMLSELQRLRVAKLNPFLLALMEAYRHTPASEPLLHNILAAVVRILIKHERPSYRIEIFTRDACSLFEDNAMSPEVRLEGLISLVDDIWIDDATFRDAFVKKSIYGPGAHLSRLRYYMEKLEQKLSERNGTPFQAQFTSQTTIEHIMPQTLNEGGVWRNSLRTPDPIQLDLKHKSYVNTIGNLTVLLTKDNPAAGNAAYSQKRDFYIHPNQTIKKLGLRRKLHIGNCALNSYFESVPNWNLQTIVDRGQFLADLALQIWNKEPWNREIK